MSDLDHNTKNTKVGTSTDGLSQRRRALLKGSAVTIPAILTLRSGSALAATSISCVQKIQATNPPVTPSTTVADPAVDPWLRQSTDCRILTKGLSTITVFRDPNIPLSNDVSVKWYKIDTTNAPENIGNAFVYQNSTKMKDGNGDGISWDYNGTTTCYVLVKVDPTGNQPNPKVYGALDSTMLNSESCASSLNIIVRAVNP